MFSFPQPALGLVLIVLLMTVQGFGQVNKGNEVPDTYYIGINPIAPVTNIRNETTSVYLPAISNQETGISISVGKIWNSNYNVETRLSFGSPNRSYTLLQVHSGFNYLLSQRKRHRLYAGIFGKLYSLHNTDTKADLVSAIGYVCVGQRFHWRRYFCDFRLNQNIYAISWSNQRDSKARGGFHPSIYKWKSPYIPYAGINIGFTFQ